MNLPGWILDHSVLPNTQISQGDLIRFENEKDPLRRLGLVVTADCDLKNKKHASAITLVSVCSADIILERYLLPEDCERKRDLILNFLLDKCGVPKAADQDLKLALTSEFIQGSTLSDDDPIKIAGDFLFGIDNFISIQNYITLMQAIKVRPKKLSALKDQIKNRGDLLILPEADSIGIRANIAWVRHIWQVTSSRIAIKTSEIKGRDGERVARLDSPYRYRLTQLIAHVFSDIGLPEFSSEIDSFLEGAYTA